MKSSLLSRLRALTRPATTVTIRGEQMSMRPMSAKMAASCALQGRQIWSALATLSGQGALAGSSKETSNRSSGQPDTDEFFVEYASSERREGLSAEAAALKASQIDSSVAILADALGGKVMRTLIVDIIKDAMRDEIDGSDSVDEIFEELDVPLIGEFLKGVGEANGGAFDPLLQRMRESGRGSNPSSPPEENG